MACDITSGFTLECRDVVGGVKNLYILSGSVDGVTGSGATGLISDLSGSGVFYKFELTRGNGDWTEAINGSTENGTVFYSETINATFHKLQSATRNQMRVLAKNPALKVIVETNNDEDGIKYFYVGEENGLQLNAGQAATGVAFGDANAYTFTFTGEEREPASPLSGSVLEDVLTGITVG